MCCTWPEAPRDLCAIARRQLRPVMRIEVGGSEEYARRRGRWRPDRFLGRQESPRGRNPAPGVSSFTPRAEAWRRLGWQVGDQVGVPKSALMAAASVDHMYAAGAAAGCVSAILETRPSLLASRSPLDKKAGSCEILCARGSDTDVLAGWRSRTWAGMLGQVFHASGCTSRCATASG